MARKKHAVDVLIKARDEASRIFGRVAVSARAMGRVFKSVANIAKTALHVAFQTIKRAAIALTAALAYCTYSTLKQEAAEVELASALRMLGEYSDEAMQKLKEQASAIQAVTVYGDEYILTLMRMAITLGVTKEKAADAAKAAIALYAGFGGGRGKPEIFLRYYIDALRGTGASLDTYIGALRKAKTPEERQLVMLDALARGWDVAKSKAESATGALKQMWAKLGDIAEVIAQPLLPAISRSARAITEWAAANEANIAYWAQKTFSYVTVIKDIFVEFIRFLKTDWKKGFAVAFDVALETLKAFGQSAFAVLKNVFTNIGFNLYVWIHNAMQQRKAMGAIAADIWSNLAGYPETKEATKGMLKTPSGKLLKTRDIWRAAPVVEKKAMEILKAAGGPAGLGYELKATHLIGLKSLVQELKEIKTDMVNAIKEKLPETLAKEFEEAWARHEQRLKALGEPPGKKPAGAPGGPGAPEPFSLEENLRALLRRGGRWQARESRFLTFAPGARFDYERQIVRNSAQQLKIQQALLRAANKLEADFRQVLDERHRREPVVVSDMF